MMSDEVVILLHEEVLSADLDGSEAAILNLRDGVYHGLNPVAARVWRLLGEHKTVGALRDVLLQEFCVDADRLTRDLIELIERLVSLGLVELRHAPGR